ARGGWREGRAGTRDAGGTRRAGVPRRRTFLLDERLRRSALDGGLLRFEPPAPGAAPGALVLVRRAAGPGSAEQTQHTLADRRGRRGAARDAAAPPLPDAGALARRGGDGAALRPARCLAGRERLADARVHP